MNAISEPEAEAAGPKGRAQVDSGANWAPRDWERFQKTRELPPWSFLDQPGFDADPCAEAMIEAQLRVEKAERAIKRWHDKLEQLQKELKSAIEHKARVAEAYHKLWDTGEIDRELLVPKCEHYKEILVSNDSAKAHNKLASHAREIADKLYADAGWAIKSLRADDKYEYIELRKSLDVMSAILDDSWSVSTVEADESFIHVTIRRERNDPLTEEVADARIAEGCEFIFRRWEEDPKLRKLAVTMTRMDPLFVHHFKEPPTGPPN